MSTEAAELFGADQTEEALRDTLLREGGVAQLMGDQRMPLMRTYVVSAPDYNKRIGWDPGLRMPIYELTHREVVFCHVPPEGTRIGDSFRSLVGIYEFVSPEGVSRGSAQAVELTPDQADAVRGNISAALQAPPSSPRA